MCLRRWNHATQLSPFADSVWNRHSDRHIHVRFSMCDSEREREKDRYRDKKRKRMN